jgi:hypothetical protein
VTYDSASPELFHGLFDDASLFPPASLAMADALTGHLRHQAAWYRDMSGPFVCPDAKIVELGAALTAADVAELDLALVLPGGATSLDAAVDLVFADPRLRLRAIELPIAVTATSEEEPVAAIAATAAALDRTPLTRATGFIEIPVRWLTADAARTVADHRYLAKLRTGGTTVEAFPDGQALARSLTALAEQRLAFKCTAGLHHAVRHRAADTGFEHHGFLNVMLAVAAALDSASTDRVAAELADSDPGRVAGKIRQLDADTILAVRELFVSFGTCSTDEPITGLVTLGLISNVAES